LFVLGTERHEARRIDNQLRGRAGRQGDHGESRFFVALQDELMMRFGGERVRSLMDTLGVADDQEIESGMVSRQIEAAQVKVEGYNFDLRKHLLEYDEVINEQRRVVYEQRTEVLRREDLRSVVWEMVEDEISSLVPLHAAGDREDWDMVGLGSALRAILPVPVDEDVEDWRNWTVEEMEGHILSLAEEAYDAKTERLGPDLMHQIERVVLLRVIDQWWVRHLTALDELRTGIGLRAFGQQDPLVTFKREGFQMFQQLLQNIRAEVARGIYHAEPMPAEAAGPRTLAGATAGRGRLIDQAMASAAASAGAAPARVGVKLGRNDPCHCGSGKKYKHCHWKTDQAGEGPPPASAKAPAGRGPRRRR
jgi:preprotein translocase subunit SecA